MTVTDLELQGPQWLFLDSDPNDGGWQCDAPWAAANGRHDHRVHVMNPMGISLVRFALGDILAGAVARELFYGRASQGGGFTGFAAYYNALNPEVAQNARNVIDGGGRHGDLSSIYFVCWSPRAVFMASPTGDPTFNFGPTEATLVVKDWRYVVRIANLAADTPEDTLLALMSQAMLRVPRLISDEAVMRPKLYMSAAFHGRLGLDKFRGVPVRPFDFLCGESVVN